MLRKSLRLQQAGYYTAEGQPVVSYKENRKYHRRTGQTIGRGRVHNEDWLDRHSTGSSRSTIADQQWSMRAPTTVGTQEPPAWASAGSQTSHVQNMRTETRRQQGTSMGSFCGKIFTGLLLLLLVLALGFKQMQVTQLQQKVRSLQLERNFASMSRGASVLHGSETYLPMWESFLQRLGLFNPQQRVIQECSSLKPGQCWSFPGNKGHLFISLSEPVSVTHVTLGHISKSQSPNGQITSAPREFSVFGLNNMDEDGTHLGTLRYDEDGPVFQTWELPASEKPDQGVFRLVKLQVEDNWGNEDYTCLYSFRVHGKPPA